MDGDQEYPTICGTGTEDYFGGAWNFEDPKGTYKQFTNLYAGLCQVLNPQGALKANQRFGMYRFHVCDPIYFEKDLKITIQALGWRNGFKRFCNCGMIFPRWFIGIKQNRIILISLCPTEIFWKTFKIRREKREKI